MLIYDNFFAIVIFFTWADSEKELRSVDITSDFFVREKTFNTDSEHQNYGQLIQSTQYRYLSNTGFRCSSVLKFLLILTTEPNLMPQKIMETLKCSSVFS